MNNQIFRNMINFYDDNAFTHNYIFGVKLHGNVYMIKADSSVLPYVLKLDKASRGNGYALRFKPNNDTRALLLALGAELICSVETFDRIVSESIYNKGEIFEKLVTEYFGQTWEKDSVPFTDDGDLTVNGTAYQIKYENASFISEKQMMRMRAA